MQRTGIKQRITLSFQQDGAHSLFQKLVIHHYDRPVEPAVAGFYLLHQSDPRHHDLHRGLLNDGQTLHAIQHNGSTACLHAMSYTAAHPALSNATSRSWHVPIPKRRSLKKASSACIYFVFPIFICLSFSHLVSTNVSAKITFFRSKSAFQCKVILNHSL